MELRLEQGKQDSYGGFEVPLSSMFAFVVALGVVVVEPAEKLRLAVRRRVSIGPVAPTSLSGSSVASLPACNNPAGVSEGSSCLCCSPMQTDHETTTCLLSSNFQFPAITATYVVDWLCARFVAVALEGRDRDRLLGAVCGRSPVFEGLGGAVDDAAPLWSTAVQYWAPSGRTRSRSGRSHARHLGLFVNIFAMRVESVTYDCSCLESAASTASRTYPRNRARASARVEPAFGRAASTALHNRPSSSRNRRSRSRCTALSSPM